MDFEFKTNLKNLMSEKSSGGMAHWWSLCLVVHEALGSIPRRRRGGLYTQEPALGLVFAWHWLEHVVARVFYPVVKKLQPISFCVLHLFSLWL